MLERANRLTKKKEFDRVFKGGRSSFDKILGIKAMANELEQNRFGIIINNKVSKKAVIRNKIRRRIREVLKKENPNLYPGNDVVVIVQPIAKNKESSEIKASIIFLFKKLRLYKNKPNPSAKISAAPHRDIDN